MPLCAHGKARKAVRLALEQIAAVGNRKAVHLLCGQRRGQRMPEIPPGKVEQRRIAMLCAVRGVEHQNRGKVVARLDCSLERLAPEVPLKRLRLLLLGENQNMRFALLGAKLRAGRGIVRVRRHQHETDAVIFTVGAGGNRRAVRGKAPGRTVLGAVTDIFGRFAPAVAVVADAGNHGKVRAACENRFHAHLVGRLIGAARPLPHAVLNRLKAVRRTRGGGNPHDACAVDRDENAVLGL